MLDLKSYGFSNVTNRVFEIFEEISKIPRGSGNMKKIADYCEQFATKLGLKFVRDSADNVVIFKNGSKGYETAKPLILQGHLDIVCQSTEECDIDFLKDGLEIHKDGDFIRAKGTTLGADNGIAVAYIMAILENSNLTHPPIEAVLTTDEEIGLLGANALDTSILKAKKMINLDSESDDILTVSCAGGQDVILNLPVSFFETDGDQLTLSIKGLLGGHSGVEIHKQRTNANILMGELLAYLNENCEFNIVSINGGTKPNAIPQSSRAKICTNDKEKILHWLQNFKSLRLSEIKKTEPDLCLDIKEEPHDKISCFDNRTTLEIINLLTTVPNGVIKMSDEIEGLVETSLNLGILATENDTVKTHHALRSNKETELKNLTEKVLNIGKKLEAKAEVFGFYPPWEFKKDSPLRELYKKCYKETFQKEIKVEAIHAGLECAVFSSTIENLDCISVGPDMQDVHTPNEKLNIKSAAVTFELLLKVLFESCNL